MSKITATLLTVLTLNSASILSSADEVSTQDINHEFIFPKSAMGQKDRPLIVYLHGCLQYEGHSLDSTKLKMWSEKLGFAILLPKQKRFINPMRCWNWFLPENQKPFQGELGQIVSLIQRYQRSHSLSREKVFAVGMSAGGIMASHLMACHPDVIAGAMIHSGSSYRMLDLNDGDIADLLRRKSPLSDYELFLRAFDCFKLSQSSRPIKMMVVHGTKDLASNLENATQVSHQFFGINQILSGVPVTQKTIFQPQIQKSFYPKGKLPWHLSIYQSANGGAIHLIEVQGMGHEWSGGPPNMPFVESRGPNVTRMGLQFFELIN